ncbi:conjugal transfer protein TrbD [Thiomonas bhubaneswarensis]|uniref:Type IV secretory pathway, TrbD component n=1 Tax=Thiomonas bhubaneswarensis TaxID=339866 RepID=A0A0K6I1C7_9BURK|nr:conjugal transfer protein TrbD [Thiomonas bhubaneswarensis]CUA96891.1 Type IV secretory pathway, TrbD component [Thiomonas bhubaneswarensis]
MNDTKTPIHDSLNRPILMMGGERQLVLLLAIVAGIFIFSLAKLWAAIIGVTLWMVGQWALSRAASYDPVLSKTGSRLLKYRRHYPAQASPFAKAREVRS